MFDDYDGPNRPRRYVVVPPPTLGPDFQAFDDQGWLRVVVHDTPGPNHYRRYLFPRDVDLRFMGQVSDKLLPHLLISDVEFEKRLISIRLRYKIVLDRFLGAELSALVQAGLTPLQIAFVRYKDAKQFARSAVKS